jgi:hypothetical protein
MTAGGVRAQGRSAERRSRQAVKVGLLWTSFAPLSSTTRGIRLARLAGLDHMVLGDHLQSFTPRSIFDERLAFWAMRHIARRLR